jgi:hypothetical protein
VIVEAAKPVQDQWMRDPRLAVAPFARRSPALT